jgi:hypothetical protein
MRRFASIGKYLFRAYLSITKLRWCIAFFKIQLNNTTKVGSEKYCREKVMFKADFIPEISFKAKVSRNIELKKHINALF